MKNFKSYKLNFDDILLWFHGIIYMLFKVCHTLHFLVKKLEKSD